VARKNRAARRSAQPVAVVARGAPVPVPAPRANGWGRLAELHPRRFFLETWRNIDAEAAEERAERTRFDYRPLVALATGAVFLTLMEYFGSSQTMDKLLDLLDPQDAPRVVETVWSRLRDSPFFRLSEFAYWAGWRVLGYFVGPALVVKLVLKGKLRDYGLETRGFSEHAWIYGFFYCIVLVAVVVVSFTADFSTYYPFYKLASRSWFDFIGWELMYAAQFFSLEFFFRGFFLKACKSAMGSHAIFCMVVPYCMIHFGKPWLEALAAILAGTVLGTLSMKTRSIWSGFLIHVSVAVSMDMAALLQTSGLPHVWWPAGL